ncbi:MAG: hypothetical protein MUE63_02210 [Xanthomonadales bacterium]|nr:hypothetical protein [Xanthomonadales bacterium]
MTEISRRSFLQVLGLGVSALAAGCQRDEAPAVVGTAPAAAPPEPLPEPLPPPSDLPFSVWEELRAVLRAAPDHLPAQADAVVEQGDPAAIFAFVRDRISMLPPGADGLQRAVTGRRWGLRGTLRCGWGTPRERADLLADLYRRAGFEAEVVEGALNRPVRVEDLLRQRGDLAFAPPVDGDTIARWHRELNITAATPAPEPDADGSATAALAEQLLAALGPQVPGPVAAAVPFSTAPPQRVPLVRVVVDGAERFANPLLPDAGFGESGVDAPVKALGGDLPGEVRLSLACARTTDPSARVVLAEGRWPLEDALGGTLIARCVPSGDFTALFTAPLASIPSFTALVGLDAPQLAAAERVANAVLGDSVSVFGDHLRNDEPGGAVRVGEEAVGGNAGAVASVSALQASVSAQAFPSLFLTVGATDAAGNPLSDLPAAAFALDEDGTPLSFVLSASHAPPPSVLLLFDGSRSLPAEFLDAGIPVLARRLADEILTADPAARFRLGGVNYGTASVSPAWLTSREEVEAEAGRVIADGSELWSALADARRSGASVIVLVTDGRASDPAERIAAARHWVHAGPPVVVVGVGDYDTASGEDLARTSGGIAVPVADYGGAVAAVLEFLRAAAARPHRLACTAPLEGPAQRRLRVRLGAAETSLEYAVPAPAARLAPPGLSGLYLTIGFGTLEITRTLAGIPWEEASPTTPVPAAVVDEVRAALAGGAVLSLEAGPPTASVWLDDFLAAKLSARALFEARGQGIDRQVAALEAGIRSLPRELPALQGAPPGGEPPVFPLAPHAVLLTSRPLPSGEGLRRVDLLPLAAWSAAAAPPEAFAATLRRSARLAVREAALYADSTLARLSGRALAVLPPSTPVPRDGPLAPWARLLDAWGFHHRLVPADDGPFAFWAVDRQGSLMGVLPDGSGGGSATDDIASQCEGVSRIAAATQLSGAGLGLPFAGLVSLQKAIALQALRAAAVVATLEDPKIPKACDKGLGDLACDWAKDTLAAATWTGYGAIDTADDIVEAAGGGGLVDC